MTSPTSPTSPVTSAVGTNDISGQLYKAVDCHAPGHDGELSLLIGDIVTDVKDLGNGWVLAKNVARDGVGIVPAHCIRPLTEITVYESNRDIKSAKSHRNTQPRAPAPPSRKSTSTSANDLKSPPSKDDSKKGKDHHNRLGQDKFDSGQSSAATGTDGKKKVQQQQRSSSKERICTVPGATVIDSQDIYAKINKKSSNSHIDKARSPLSTASDSLTAYKQEQNTDNRNGCDKADRGSTNRLQQQQRVNVNPQLESPQIVCFENPDCLVDHHLLSTAIINSGVEDSEYGSLALHRANKPQMVVKPNLEKVASDNKMMPESFRRNTLAAAFDLMRPEMCCDINSADYMLHVDCRPKRQRTSTPPHQLPLMMEISGDALPSPPLDSCLRDDALDRYSPPPPPPPPSIELTTSLVQPIRAMQHQQDDLLTPGRSSVCAGTTGSGAMYGTNYATNVVLENVTNDVIGQLNGVDGGSRPKIVDANGSQGDKYADIKRHYGCYRDYRTVEDYVPVGEHRRRCGADDGCGVTSCTVDGRHRFRASTVYLRHAKDSSGSGGGNCTGSGNCGGDESKSYEHIYYTEKKAPNKSARLALSLFGSSIISLLLFLWMYYYLGYSLIISVTISAVVGVILIVALAASRLCRCCVAIALPSLCTNRGQIAYLIIVTGFLLGGPVSNTQRNMADVARSLTCSADQAYNQTMLLLAPFDEMMEQLDSTVAHLYDVAHNVREGLAPLETNLENVEEKLRHGRINLMGTKRTCRTVLDKALQECTAGIGEANRKCQWVLGTLGSVYHTAKDALDQLNLEKYAKKTGQAVPARPQPVQRRDTIIPEGEFDEGAGMPLNNKDICEPLDVKIICKGLNDTDRQCHPSNWIGENIQEAVNATQHAMRELQKTLQFHISSRPYYDTRLNASRLIYQVQRRVEAEYSRRTEYFDMVLSILVKLTPISILLLLRVSYVYIKYYVSRDAYDNIYVTRALKDLDRKRMEVARETLLPLKKYERNYLVDVTMTDLSPPEDNLYKAGLSILVIHLCLSLSCYVFDYVLYWIMALIEYHARPSFDITGRESLKDVVDGQGIIVDLLRHFLNSFHTKNLFGLTVDTYACIPRPVAPSVVNLLVVFFMYFVLILVILLKAYLLRARNRLTALFYPERERVRVVHLYNILLGQRSRMQQTLQQSARATNRENVLQRQISLIHRMASNCPPCRPFVHQSSRCLVCRCSEDQAFRDCETDGCPGVYCSECFDDLARRCPICLHGFANDDDEWDYMEYDDDLNIYCKASKIHL